MNPKRTLNFKYSSDDRDEYAIALVDKLDELGAEYVAYDDVNYWLFKVQKPKAITWNQLMHEINNIHSAKYWFTNTIIQDGQEYVDL